ncbi:hypothetical protein K0M31_000159 [Melipona bicolor]|uniref:Uncharacterized protein n=1 Tax=Melipona bicolor TaxID=60889 RepID=A0AA40KWS7_9HYME|nr:hypothetical protein K0M31_000159 [Melipona bicolor]
MKGLLHSRIIFSASSVCKLFEHVTTDTVQLITQTSILGPTFTHVFFNSTNNQKFYCIYLSPFHPFARQRSNVPPDRRILNRNEEPRVASREHRKHIPPLSRRGGLSRCVTGFTLVRRFLEMSSRQRLE